MGKVDLVAGFVKECVSRYLSNLYLFLSSAAYLPNMEGCLLE
jgi:hypothetical protein